MNTETNFKMRYLIIIIIIQLVRDVRVNANTFYTVDETYATNTHKRLAVASLTNKWQARHSNAPLCYSNSKIVDSAEQRKCGKMIPEKASRRNRGRHATPC